MVEIIDLQIKYKLTPCMARGLWLLLTTKVVTPNMLEVDPPITTDTKVLMHRIRRRLKDTGIEIKSQRSAGYWLDNASREIILRDVGEDQMSLPFATEGNSEPLAAAA